MITFRAQSYHIYKQSSEKHLYGIQENRIHLSLIFRNGDGGIALKNDTKQQKHDTRNSFPVERLAVTSHSDDKEQSDKADNETDNLMRV